MKYLDIKQRWLPSPDIRNSQLVFNTVSPLQVEVNLPCAKYINITRNNESFESIFAPTNIHHHEQFNRSRYKLLNSYNKL